MPSPSGISRDTYKGLLNHVGLNVKDLRTPVNKIPMNAFEIFHGKDIYLTTFFSHENAIIDLREVIRTNIKILNTLESKLGIFSSDRSVPLIVSRIQKMNLHLMKILNR